MVIIQKKKPKEFPKHGEIIMVKKRSSASAAQHALERTSRCFALTPKNFHTIFNFREKHQRRQNKIVVDITKTVESPIHPNKSLNLTAQRTTNDTSYTPILWLIFKACGLQVNSIR